MPFQEYSPEQAALLPLHVRDVLSEQHLVFLIHGSDGETGFEAMGSSLQRGRATAVSSGAAAEGIVVWVCVGSKVLAQAGAAGARGSGVSLLGGRSGARP